jgi:hypothetical protein
MSDLARTPKALREALRLATQGDRGGASVCNYSVWDERHDGLFEMENGLSRDEAVGFARGLSRAGILYGGSSYNPIVRCGAFVCWPEDRYGELLDETGKPHPEER